VTLSELIETLELIKHELGEDGETGIETAYWDGERVVTTSTQGETQP
jgi:hypothetical protein